MSGEFKYSNSQTFKWPAWPTQASRAFCEADIDQILKVVSSSSQSVHQTEGLVVVKKADENARKQIYIKRRFICFSETYL